MFPTMDRPDSQPHSTAPLTSPPSSRALVDWAQIARAFRHSPGFMCLISGTNYVVEAVNEQYLQLVGRRDLLHRPLREALPELKGQGYFEILDQIFATGKEFVGRDMSVLLQRERGRPPEKRFVDFVLEPLLGQDGAVVGVFCHGVDNTEVRETLQERERLLMSEREAKLDFERANKMKDDFLSTLSHELRTPLNAIVGWSQVLRMGTSDAAELAEGLEVIERNALAQAKIIDDLLDMSRIISGKIQLDIQRFDLTDIVKAGIETVRPAADAKGVTLMMMIDPLVGSFAGDPNRLHQVLWNLLSNAIKFTPKGGRVRVALNRREQHIELSVVDTGMGISSDFLPFVFDRFRQADASTTRKHGGLGLGLAIVKQLVELHGGTVAVTSPGPDKGARFSVLLPMTAVPGRPQLPTDRYDPKAQKVSDPEHDVLVFLPGVKVLVVDDEADARAVVKKILEDVDAVVDTAPSAIEALEKIMKGGRYDVLVSDIGMPDVDGYRLIRRIRKLPPEQGGAIPALALTAFARAEDRMRSIRCGFNMHIAKPIERAELITMVASLAGVIRR
jgi:signal transduction histidine kinase/ActR/RegA family two-component response regulator